MVVKHPFVPRFKHPLKLFFMLIKTLQNFIDAIVLSYRIFPKVDVISITHSFSLYYCVNTRICNTSPVGCATRHVRISSAPRNKESAWDYKNNSRSWDSASIAMVTRSPQKVAENDLAVSFSLLGTFLPAHNLRAVAGRRSSVNHSCLVLCFMSTLLLL